ncbi:MAG: FliM/FliN family flagellar motor switch protein [Candidatus Acidiferrales bacterium]
MSPQDPPKLSAAAQDYARLWGECTARALGQLQGATFTPAPQEPVPPPPPAEPPIPVEPAAAVPAEPAAAAPAEPAAPSSAQPAAPSPAEPVAAASAENLSLLFTVSGRVAGDQLFNLSKSDGVRLAQMLMAEPLDPAAAFSEGYADALNEIFRQFAGLAATAGKAQYDGEVSFNFESGKTADWKPASTAIWTFTAPQVAPIQWTLLLSPELLAAIEAAHAATLAAAAAETVASKSPAPPPAPAPAAPAKAAPPASPVAAPPPARPSFAMPAPVAAFAAAGTAAEGGGSNLDLLLDVVLEATLRFGERQMLLREILELHPGSVVELNRRIQEPAELLVAGRVIAHGEVVIVDGSYGLRITDVSHPHQRLESVEA